MKYAAQTTVSSEKSQAEIKQTLTRYGANKFAYFEEESRAAIIFEFKGRRLRFVVNLPDRTADEFRYTRHKNSWNRQLLSIDAQHDRWEQACRQRWRALALAIKAKLEAVESQIATFEEEFMAYILLPDNSTVGEFMRPQIEVAYSQGRMPKMLPGIGETSEAN